jgi:hypothetical protein
LNVTVTTTVIVLQCTGSWLDYAWIGTGVQIFTAVVMALLTYRIAHYTEVTIREGQLNRRKEAVEKQFKEYFYPMWIALTKAKSGRADIRKTHNLPTNCYLFTIEESEKMAEKIGSFMYSDLNEFRAFAETLRDKTQYTSDKRYCYYAEADLDSHFAYLSRKCVEISGELDVLIGRPDTHVEKYVQKYQELLRAIEARLGALSKEPHKPRGSNPQESE